MKLLQQGRCRHRCHGLRRSSPYLYSLFFIISHIKDKSVNIQASSAEKLVSEHGDQNFEFEIIYVTLCLWRCLKLFLTFT